MTILIPNAPLRGAICIVFVIFESVFGHFEKTAKTYFWVSFWSVLNFWKNHGLGWFWLSQVERIVPWKKSFVKITSGNVEKRFKNPKNLKIFENVQTLPIASECIRMHPNGSEWIRKPRKARENLKKLAKTLKNFAKTSKNFAKKFTKTFFTA